MEDGLSRCHNGIKSSAIYLHLVDYKPYSQPVYPLVEGSEVRVEDAQGRACFLVLNDHCYLLTRIETSQLQVYIGEPNVAWV